MNFLIKIHVIVYVSHLKQTTVYTNELYPKVESTTSDLQRTIRCRN